jgi:hypothetical protein
MEPGKWVWEPVRIDYSGNRFRRVFAIAHLQSALTPRMAIPMVRRLDGTTR